MVLFSELVYIYFSAYQTNHLKSQLTKIQEGRNFGPISIRLCSNRDEHSNTLAVHIPTTFDYRITCLVNLDPVAHLRANYQQEPLSHAQSLINPDNGSRGITAITTSLTKQANIFSQKECQQNSKTQPTFIFRKFCSKSKNKK